MSYSKEHELDYIKKYYNMPFLKIGMRAEICGFDGTIVGADHHIKLKCDKTGHVFNAHPKHCATYYDDNGEIISKY